MTKVKREAVYNPKADKKWRDENKEHRRYLTYRGTARMFIRDHATMDDLSELKNLMEEREKKLKDLGG